MIHDCWEKDDQKCLNRHLLQKWHVEWGEKVTDQVTIQSGIGHYEGYDLRVALLPYEHFPRTKKKLQEYPNAIIWHANYARGIRPRARAMCGSDIWLNAYEPCSKFQDQ